MERRQNTNDRPSGGCLGSSYESIEKRDEKECAVHSDNIGNKTVAA